MKNASGKAWEELKSGANAALEELEKSFNKASSHSK
jgi:hypothetical protein